MKVSKRKITSTLKRAGFLNKAHYFISEWKCRNIFTIAYSIHKPKEVEKLREIQEALTGNKITNNLRFDNNRSLVILEIAMNENYVFTYEQLKKVEDDGIEFDFSTDKLIKHPSGAYRWVRFSEPFDYTTEKTIAR